MRLYYLSNVSFADCDINVLHHLSAKYTITYGIVVPKKNANYSKQQLSDYCALNNINQSIFHVEHRYRDPRTLLVYFRILLNVLNSKSDLIYVNNFDMIYFNLLMLFINKKKTIIAMHDVVSHSNTPFRRMVNFSRSLLLKNFDKFLTFSQSQANALKQLYPAHTVYMIPLALKDFGITTNSNKNDNIINFLFFGNVKPYKGLDKLLRSVDRLSKKYSCFTLTIAGRCTNWQEEYELLIKNKSVVIKHIRFIENDEIPFFFSNADYLVLPYKDATQSGPLMIAYNYNVPIIASNIAGLKEFIEDGTTGYLFDQDSDYAIDKVLEDAILRSRADYTNLLKNIAAFTQNNLAIESTINAYDNLFQGILKS